MSKSILQTKKECWYCHTTIGLHEHHVLFGSANRKKAEQDGLKVYLCGRHHNLSCEGVHCGNKELDLKLKKLAQTEYLKTHTFSEWMNRYHKNYL